MPLGLIPDSIIFFVRDWDFAKQPAEMDERIGDLLAWDKTVHRGSLLKKSLQIM
jgi:hypothetical protein